MDQLENEMGNGLRERFFEVLDKKQIKTVFQPIVSLRDGIIYGYEALSRGPHNTGLNSPNVLFECAEKFDKVWDLESLCRVKAIEAAHDLQTPIRLFLNVNPNLMHDAKFKQGFTKEYLDQYSIDPERIVFEINEKNPIENISVFKKAVKNYEEQNYKIAVDDAGSGYSGLNMISEIRPHFIKLDINLIRDIDKDVTKQALVRSMAEYAQLTNTNLIAEGIETEDELLKLIDIGVQYGQGYFLQRPDPSIKPIDEDVLKIIFEANTLKNRFEDYMLSDIYISNIAIHQMPLSPKTRVSLVYDLVNKNPDVPGFCIVEDEKVAGVITRNELFKHLSGLYGYNLYSNKQIKTIMSKEFLCLDYRASIEYVARIAMKRDAEKIYDFITITKNGKYFGIVTIKDLLERSVQVKVNNARHLNPLSGLPGNVLIDRQLERCIDSKLDYAIMYIDINNFKSYNDVYGFGCGDRVIKRLAEILLNSVTGNNFVGHIGGDDFLAILCNDSIERVCGEVIEAFEKSIPLFYNQKDLANGFIIAKNRHGIVEKFPLLSISIAGTYSGRHADLIGLSEHIAKIKNMCKQNKGSNYMIA